MSDQKKKDTRHEAKARSRGLRTFIRSSHKKQEPHAQPIHGAKNRPKSRQETPGRPRTTPPCNSVANGELSILRKHTSNLCTTSRGTAARRKWLRGSAGLSTSNPTAISTSYTSMHRVLASRHTHTGGCCVCVCAFFVISIVRAIRLTSGNTPACSRGEPARTHS